MISNMNEPAAIVNMDMVNQVFAKIEANRERWNQANWATNAGPDGDMCNTSFCFAGWALSINGRLRVDGRYIYPVDENNERTQFSIEAANLLGFNDALINTVFLNMEDDYEVFKRETLAAIEQMGNWTQAEVLAWLAE